MMTWPGVATRWVKCLAFSIQLGLSVAVLIVVRYQLQGTSLIAGRGLTRTCYLALPQDWTAACTYGQVVGLVSLLASVAQLALQLYLIIKSSSNIVPNLHSSKCPNRVLLAQFCILLLVLAWWIAAACVFHIFSQRASAAGYPKATQRTVIIVCSWASVALMGSLLVAWLFLRYWLNSSVNSHSNAPMLQQQSWTPHTHAPSIQAQPPAAVSYAVPAASGQQYPLSMRPGMQQQQTSEAGVVMGIPLIPVPALATPLTTISPAASLAGASPGSVQMAIISGDSMASQRVPRLMTIPARQAQRSAVPVQRSLSAGVALTGRPQLRHHVNISTGSVGNIRVVNPSQPSTR